MHRRRLRNLASGLKPIYSDNAWLGKIHGRDLRRIEEYSFHWFKYGVPRAAWSFQLGTSPRTTDYRRFDTKLGQDSNQRRSRELHEQIIDNELARRHLRSA